VHWDGLDSNGRPVEPGIYMVRLKGTQTQATHSVVLMN